MYPINKHMGWLWLGLLWLYYYFLLKHDIYRNENLLSNFYCFEIDSFFWPSVALATIQDLSKFLCDILLRLFQLKHFCFSVYL